MLSVEQNDEGLLFPFEEEVMNMLKGNPSLPVTQPEINDAVCLLFTKFPVINSSKTFVTIRKSEPR